MTCFKTRERATPHKLALAILLHIYVKPSDKPELKLNYIHIKRLQAFLVHSIRDIDSANIVEPVLSETCEEVTVKIPNGSAIARELRRTLFQIATPDDLFDLLQDLKYGLLGLSDDLRENEIDKVGRPSHIDRSCVFGVFARRVLNSLDYSFESLSRLFHELSLYVKASISNSSSLLPKKGKGKPTMQAEEKQFQSFLSKRQLLRLLHSKAQQIESQIGVTSPKQIESEIVKLLEVSPDLPRAHFLRYLNCLFHQEYQGAVDSLHTYFDCCTRFGGPTPVKAWMRLDGAKTPENTATAKGRPMMQYAILNLAALHFKFGHINEATLAIEETIRVAQQNGDHICVAFALSWFFRLAIGTGKQNAKELLDRTLERAHALNLNKVEGLTCLLLAQLKLLGISRPRSDLIKEIPFNECTREIPAAITTIELIKDGTRSVSQGVGTYMKNIPAQSPHPQRQLASMNSSQRDAAQFDMSVLINGQLSTPSSQFSDTMNISEGRAVLLQSTAWELFGHQTLSSTFALSYLYFFGGANGKSKHICISICKVAMAQSQRGSLEHLCPSIKDGTRQKIEKNSCFQPALLLLLDAKKKYSSEYNNVIVLCLCFLLYKRELLRHNFRESFALAALLQALACSEKNLIALNEDTNNEGFSVDSEILWLEMLSALGRFETAHSEACKLIRQCTTKQLFARQMEIEVVLAQVLHKSYSPVLSLPHVLRSISRAEKNSHDTIYVKAVIKLAMTHYNLGLVGKALTSLERVLPHVLAHGSLSLQGETYITSAKCHIFLYFAKEREKKRSSSLGSFSKEYKSLVYIQKILVKSISCFEKAEMWSSLREALYLVSRVYNAIAESLKAKKHNNSRITKNYNTQYNHYIMLRNRAAKRFMLEQRRLLDCGTDSISYFSSDERLLQKISCF